MILPLIGAAGAAAAGAATGAFDPLFDPNKRANRQQAHQHNIEEQALADKRFIDREALKNAHDVSSRGLDQGDEALAQRGLQVKTTAENASRSSEGVSYLQRNLIQALSSGAPPETVQAIQTALAGARQQDAMAQYHYTNQPNNSSMSTGGAMFAGNRTGQDSQHGMNFGLNFNNGMGFPGMGIGGLPGGFPGSFGGGFPGFGGGFPGFGFGGGFGFPGAMASMFSPMPMPFGGGMGGFPAVAGGQSNANGMLVGVPVGVSGPPGVPMTEAVLSE